MRVFAGLAFAAALAASSSVQALAQVRLKPDT